MPSAISKPVRNSRHLEAAEADVPRQTAPIKVVGASATGREIVTVTFDQAVTLNGVPDYTTDIAGAYAIMAMQTSPTTVAMTFSDSVAAANVLNIPHGDGAARNQSGGFVSASTVPIETTSLARAAEPLAAIGKYETPKTLGYVGAARMSSSKTAGPRRLLSAA